jgi:predicted nucleotidyltransferase
MNDKLSQLLADLRQRFEQIYGDQLQRMILFGSQARGDAESESDVDVMVVLNGTIRAADEIERTGGVTSDLSLEFNTVLSCLFISAERFETERSPLLLNVRREGVAV